MWIRKLYLSGDSMMITIPKDVRRTGVWANARHVEIEYHPPHLIIRPLTAEDLMRRPRTEGEELVDG